MEAGFHDAQRHIRCGATAARYCRFMNTTTAAPAIQTGRLRFTVETIDAKADCDRPCYRLTGDRGARYRTMRNVHSGRMFLIHEDRRSGIVRAFASVRLCDAKGGLNVVTL